MKFLIGLFLGGAISVGVMSLPEPRLQLLEQMTHIVETAKLLSQKATISQESVDITPPVAANEISEPVSNDEIEQIPGDSKLVDTALPEDELSNETNELATKPNEEDDVPFSTLGTSLFQVAWSPFRSETSAKGFAARLEHQLSQEFRVIKTGPGRYEVGFHFKSDAERFDVLKAINEITGFESTTPPRIVKL